MKLTNKEKVAALIDSFNTKDESALAFINTNKYIQHNLSIGDGYEAFTEMLKRRPSNTSAKIIRAFQDGDYVFTHSEYNFGGQQAAFDVFRFEDGLIVEHWDNLLEIQVANLSGKTQFDGATDITDKERTKPNKQLVKELLQHVFINGEINKISTYIDSTKYIQHNTNVTDNLDNCINAKIMSYDKIHMVLGEGNFVLSICEGKQINTPTAFYDLFRLKSAKIVEHWDVISPIPPRSEWKNNNGKF